MIKSVIFRCAAIFASAFMVPATAFAGSVNGTVSPVVLEANFALFSMSVAGSNRPACATSGRWAIDVSTTGGQARYAAVLTALAGNRNVTVFGQNVCTVSADSETVQYIAVY